MRCTRSSTTTPPGASPSSGASPPSVGLRSRTGALLGEQGRTRVGRSPCRFRSRRRRRCRPRRCNGSSTPACIHAGAFPKVGVAILGPRSASRRPDPERRGSGRGCRRTRTGPCPRRRAPGVAPGPPVGRHPPGAIAARPTGSTFVASLDIRPPRISAVSRPFSKRPRSWASRSTSCGTWRPGVRR